VIVLICLPEVILPITRTRLPGVILPITITRSRGFIIVLVCLPDGIFPITKTIRLPRSFVQAEVGSSTIGRHQSLSLRLARGLGHQQGPERFILHQPPQRCHQPQRADLVSAVAIGRGKIGFARISRVQAHMVPATVRITIFR
jgi:hypothetical protein